MLSSPEETRLVDQILPSEGPDTLSADAAVEAFQPADLPPDVLARVWDLADEGQKAYLTRDEVAKAVRLIGWAQRGFPVEQDLIEQRTIREHMSITMFLTCVQKDR